MNQDKAQAQEARRLAVKVYRAIRQGQRSVLKDYTQIGPYDPIGSEENQLLYAAWYAGLYLEHARQQTLPDDQKAPQRYKPMPYPPSRNRRKA